MEQKKLLFVLNPRAGKNKPRGPLFDAVKVLCQAGYLVHIHETTGQGDATKTVLEHQVPIWKWEGHVIWGLTGRVIRNLLEILE